MPKTRIKPPSSTPNDVRPIGARALKSAMDTLRPQLFEAHLLDLFAGQGRFGITASDEGLASVTFVEKDSKTAADLKRFVESRQFPHAVKANVHTRDAFHFLETCHDTFDIVFADPPFPLWDESFGEQLFRAVIRVLKPGAIFLVKHPSRMILSSHVENLKQFKSSDFGESRLIYFAYET